MAKILIALPVYNEAKFIENLLFEISKYAPKRDILVVDDGSTDGTGEIVTRAGAQTIRHQQNKGKGAAILTALFFAKHHGYDWVICMDGDGQHDPAHLSDFFRQIEHGDATLILGNRIRRTIAMPLHRRLSNGITSILISLVAGGTRIHDSQCGYRAINARDVNLLALKEGGFQLESEILIQLSRKGGKIRETRINTIYGSESSSIHLVADTLRFIRLILRYFWK